MITLFLDAPQFTNIIFYPRKHTEPQNLDPSSTRVLKFPIEKKIMIGGFYFHNAPELPTILLFHGNGELALEYQYFTPLFFKCGVNLAVVDFRGYGFSTGTPSFSALFSDAFPIYTQFIDWLKTQNQSDSVFLLGRSLGSTCAAEIGSRNPPELRGVIFESGIGSAFKIMSDLFRIKVPTSFLEDLKDFSNDSKAAQFQKPVLIIHGTQDWIVPPEHAQILFDALPEDLDKKLVLISGAGHNNIFQFQQEYFSPLKAFIEKYK